MLPAASCSCCRKEGLPPKGFNTFSQMHDSVGLLVMTMIMHLGYLARVISIQVTGQHAWLPPGSVGIESCWAQNECWESSFKAEFLQYISCCLLQTWNRSALLKSIRSVLELLLHLFYLWLCFICGTAVIWSHSVPHINGMFIINYRTNCCLK